MQETSEGDLRQEKYTCSHFFLLCLFLQPLNNVHEDKMSGTKMDNGPVDFTKEPGNQGLTKKSKLDQDTR